MAVSNEGRGGVSNSQFEKTLLELKSVLEVSDEELVSNVLADTGGRFMDEEEMRLYLRANLITNLIPQGDVELLVPFAKSMLRQLSKEVESANGGPASDTVPQKQDTLQPESSKEPKSG